CARGFYRDYFDCW
nr:immunoglobulin heavy chain junction region [Mus musculus]